MGNGQCFRVASEVETGTWVLLCGSVLLAFVHHFLVMAATCQEEDDFEKWRESGKFGKCGIWRGEVEKGVVSAEMAAEAFGGGDLINPVPPKFTDYYSWVLKNDVSVQLNR